jgi:uncharacterized coiled-coil protein SlyX
MEQLEHRVVKLEVRADNTDSLITEMRNEAKVLEKSISSIEKTLHQIKYLAMGAAFVVVAQFMGLDKAIKLIFGV